VGILHRWQSHPDPQQAAEKSQQLFHHWLSLNKSTTLDTAQPFLLTMKSWYKVNDSYKAADVLELWTKHLEGDLELAPTREAYHILLKTFSQQQGGCSSMKKESLNLLDYMERMQSIQPPDTETYAHVLACLIQRSAVEHRHGTAEQWQQVQTLLDRLNTVYQRGERRHAYYRLQAYSHVVCFAGSVNVDALAYLQEITLGDLPMAISFWKQHKGELADPSHLVGIAYQSVLSKLLRNKDAQKMEDLITRLEKDAPNELLLPWPQHYKMVIEGWSNTISTAGNSQAHTALGSHCEELLQRMEKRHFENDALTPISLAAYERVLWIYMKGQEHPAERLLAHVMALLEEKKITRAEPLLTDCWNHCLHAYLYREEPEGTLKLWHRMQSMDITPNGITHNIVLTALSQSTHLDAARYAQHILTALKESDMASESHYASVLVALSRSSEKGAATSAQALLEELEQAYDATRKEELRPSAIIYNAVISAWGRSRQHDAAVKAERVMERMKERANVDQRCPAPSVITYTAVLDALSRQGNSQAAEKAESMLFKTMENPQQMSYTCVMSAWARSGSNDAPERVMAIYNRLLLAYKESDCSELLRPDQATFGLLLDLWAKSKRTDAGEHAEGILRDMQENGVAANTVNYNNVILAHARSKKAFAFDRAEALLREMEERYSAGGGDEEQQTVKPNIVTHTNVIQALKRSRIKNKAQTAWDLFQSTLRAYKNGNEDVRPNVITINSVITACAFTVGDDQTRERAVKLALAAVVEMERQEITPNSTTFRMLLEAIGRQVSDMSERNRMSAYAFSRCRRENLVDSGVVDALRRFVPLLYEKVSSQLETHPVDMKETIDRRKP
jgi:pentatricopeptide repeat protein